MSVFRNEFQSTPPARGATPSLPVLCNKPLISIHAPREGGDLLLIVLLSGDCGISIHAPREGGDGQAHPGTMAAHDFNPRPPRGGRQGGKSYVIVRRVISIHAPREGGDLAGGVPDHRGGISIHAPREGGDPSLPVLCNKPLISIHAPREGGDSKDAQFYLRIFDKQVELLRFLGKIRGGCLRNPEKDRRFLGKSLANLPEISGHLDFAGGGKAHPGYPCAVPLPRRAACVRGSGDPPADRCSSYRNAPLFSHIASLDSKSADCLSQNP